VPHIESHVHGVDYPGVNYSLTFSSGVHFRGCSSLAFNPNYLKTWEHVDVPTRYFCSVNGHMVIKHFVAPIKPVPFRHAENKC